MFLSKRKMNQPSITFAVSYLIKNNSVICKHFKSRELNKYVNSYIIKDRWHIFVIITYNGQYERQTIIRRTAVNGETIWDKFVTFLFISFGRFRLFWWMSCLELLQVSVLNLNKIKYTMDPGRYLLMKTNK